MELTFTHAHFTWTKRHLLGVLRKSQTCQCGCRGYCTVYAVMEFLAWSFRAGGLGKHPELTWRGQPYRVPRKLQDIDNISRCALVQLKADWSEFVSTFSLPSWKCKYTPCIFCKCQKEDMHLYSGCSVQGHSW
eukprot:2148058-Pyramimonas_sp.AAC.1